MGRASINFLSHTALMPRLDATLHIRVSIPQTSFIYLAPSIGQERKTGVLIRKNMSQGKKKRVWLNQKKQTKKNRKQKTRLKKNRIEKTRKQKTRLKKNLRGDIP